MDKIILSDAKLICNIGDTEEERRMKQEIYVDVELGTDVVASSQSDALSDTIDYSAVHATMQRISEDKAYNLIESLAEAIAVAILDEHSPFYTRVVVKKPRALADRHVKYVAVDITRENE